MSFNLQLSKSENIKAMFSAPKWLPVCILFRLPIAKWRNIPTASMISTCADSFEKFVLNSHKDKGGKKTASRTTRLPRLFIMIRLSKVRRICCYKTIFSYISFTFCHGFAVVPCNSGRNL